MYEINIFYNNFFIFCNFVVSIRIYCEIFFNFRESTRICYMLGVWKEEGSI